ncbi:efflux RND transporter periplasmic adaptor subunit [bacterium]|nr:efflux RND transporter periplasmic adaptor subunit [bacterium]
MNSSPMNRLGLFLLFAAILAGGGFLLREHFVKGAAEHTSHDHAEAEHGAEHASAEEPAAFTESIEFPQEMWESAGIKVQPVTRAPLNEVIQLTGKIALNEDRLAHIFPLVEGRVDEVKVQFGQHVKKGELLVVVQSKEVGQGMLQLYQDRLKLEFAELKDQWTKEISSNTLSMIEMLRAGKSIDQIESSLKDRILGDYRERLMTAYVSNLKAEGHLARLSPLSDSGAVPARQLLEAKSDLNATRATLQALLEQISQDATQAARLSAQSVQELKTSIAIAETNLRILGFQAADLAQIDPAAQGEKLAHYPVMAPFDGTVISKDVVLLERVGPERQILTIADLSTVWVTADIYETHLPLLAQLSQQTVQLRCESWPDKTFAAQIFYTGDVVQETTRTIALRATATNADGLLKPGMFVTVELPSLHSGEVLQVPMSAIQDHAGETFVFVQTGDGTFARRDVTLGRNTPDAVEIVSGVTAEEPVVIAGGFALKSKMLAGLLEE